MGIYIKNKQLLEEVNSWNQKGLLTLNNFHLGKAIRRGKRTCDEELRNITLKYQNATTQSRTIKNTKLINQEQSCKK